MELLRKSKGEIKLGKVLDLNSRLAAKKSNEDMGRWKAFFLEQFGDQPKEVLSELMKAIQDKDHKRYMEITQPILMQNAIREVNKGEL